MRMVVVNGSDSVDAPAPHEEHVIFERVARHLSAMSHAYDSERVLDYFTTPERNKQMRAICLYAGVDEVQFGLAGPVVATKDLDPAQYGGTPLPPGLNDDDKSLIPPCLPDREKYITASIYTDEGVRRALEDNMPQVVPADAHDLARIKKGRVTYVPHVQEEEGEGGVCYFFMLAMDDGQPLLVSKEHRCMCLGEFGAFYMRPGLVLLVRASRKRGLEILDVRQCPSGHTMPSQGGPSRRLTRAADAIRALLEQNIPGLCMAQHYMLPEKWPELRAFYTTVFRERDARGGALFFPDTMDDPMVHVPRSVGTWI